MKCVTLPFVVLGVCIIVATAYPLNYDRRYMPYDDNQRKFCVKKVLGQDNCLNHHNYILPKFNSACESQLMHVMLVATFTLYSFM